MYIVACKMLTLDLTYEKSTNEYYYIFEYAPWKDYSIYCVNEWMNDAFI